ncbi:putative rpp14 family protein [Phaeomoniella chlamydospora]|uniref:Putative rpp14 family protein n=1 Tax=Phaeomoniella chlamydospora TaxID=158046 RepID=A0A0G2EXX2_PHACM|nr:putative rpp14 family protein [Phaeomoniella chlamydospora]
MVRIKHRYLLVDIVFPTADHKNVAPSIAFNKACPKWFDAGSMVRLIRANVSENFGDYGAGAIGGSLSIKYFSQATSTAIIRCPRNHYRIVWAALTFASYLARYSGKRDEERVSCIFRVVHVSGTIKKSEEEAIRRARKQILAARSADSSALDSFFAKRTGDGIDESDSDVGHTTMQGYESEND